MTRSSRFAPCSAVVALAFMYGCGQVEGDRATAPAPEVRSSVAPTPKCGLNAR